MPATIRILTAEERQVIRDREAEGTDRDWRGLRVKAFEVAIPPGVWDRWPNIHVAEMLVYRGIAKGAVWGFRETTDYNRTRAVAFYDPSYPPIVFEGTLSGREVRVTYQDLIGKWEG